MDPRNVFVQMQAESRQNLFEKMGQVLLANGAICDTFVDALNEREDSYPTGLPGRDYGVAIPHVDPKHVVVPGLAAATLQKPVPFIMMGSKAIVIEASVVFIVMLKDFDEQIDFLKSLMGVIQSHDFIAELIKCTSPDEMYKKLKKEILQ